MSKTQFSKQTFFLMFFLAPVIAVVVGVAGSLISMKLEKQKPLPVFGTVLPFELTNQDGAAFASSSLEGKVWIADFIFTRCAGPCPLMTQAMSKLKGRFKPESPLHWVSFSVDPGYDTPAILKEYSELHHLDLRNWVFLTGDKETLYDIAIKQFYLGITEEQAKEAVGNPESLILHSTKFVLIDPQMNIRGYYDSSDPKNMEALVKDAVTLMKAVH